jgi:hypothetical protein
VSAPATTASVGAKAHARAGRFGEAERLAERAIQLLQGTDSLSERGSSLIDLAEVLHLASRHDDADTAARHGLELLERKGNRQAYAQARSRLGALEVAVLP